MYTYYKENRQEYITIYHNNVSRGKTALDSIIKMLNIINKNEIKTL